LLLVANSVETRHIAPACRNPEIASRLSMGRGTVKTHLAHVYAKLQVANRTELARLAGGKS
jgi:DNA-binding NarL/FixJ family response regulator